jgi:hypothetical protein
LAALAVKAGGGQQAGFGLTGDDRFMADYLRSELLAHLPPELVEFLTRTAVLERLSGPLCDAVLATSGSGRVLESLEDSNLLLAALDRQRQWYRYHHLFRELLRAELELREPELVAPRTVARSRRRLRTAAPWRATWRCSVGCCAPEPSRPPRPPWPNAPSSRWNASSGARPRSWPSRPSRSCRPSTSTTTS